MSLTINPINSNSSGYKKSFKANVSTTIARELITRDKNAILDDSPRYYETCMAIAGPKIYDEGVSGVLNRCIAAIIKQFPDLVADSAKHGQEINISPLYKETPEALSAMRRIQTVRNADPRDIYDRSYVF